MDEPKASFETYCRANNITEAEHPAAFAAYLHYLSNGEWDGDMDQVDGPRKSEAEWARWLQEAADRGNPDKARENLERDELREAREQGTEETSPGKDTP